MRDREQTRRRFGLEVEAQLDALYGVALRLTGNAADAEDLVSEAVTKAWAAIDSLKDWNGFRAWTFRIMRNQFLSDHRRSKRRPDVVAIGSLASDAEDDLAPFLCTQSDEFLSWWANPEIAVVNRLLGEQILVAVDSIPEIYRVTILLVKVDGLRYDEAAELLGVPRGTVRSRMKRGRTLLQKALWEEAVDAGLVPAQEVRG